MRSTFGGLQVANSALAAQRRAIEAAGQNIANVNTPGYSRQRVDTASMASHTAGIHTGSVTWGVGVEVTGQSRIVDDFLIQRVNSERAGQGLADEVQTTYERLELTFGEPSENGLAAQLEDFWDAWDAVVTTPEDMAARSALLQRAEGVADRFADLSASIAAQTEDVIQRAKVTVTEVNAMAGQIARLNGEISAASDLGSTPNELLDQRDELVRTLSDNIGVRTRVGDDGMMSINVGGTALVQGTRSHELSLQTNGSPRQISYAMSNTSVAVEPDGGSLAGLKRSANTILPSQQEGLDAVAVMLRDSVNDKHQAGKGLDELGGRSFFDGSSARDLELHPDVLGQPENIAAAHTSEGKYGGSNAAVIAELAGETGGPDDVYREMIAQLGVDSQTANRTVELQSRLTEQAQGQRESVSGVSIDEEMTNLVAFQQAYSAAGRYMTSIDEMLDTLINRTGMVGR